MKILRSVEPTSEQLGILTEHRPGFFVIRGAAGSGKTTTALLRLKFVCGQWLSRKERLGQVEPVRVLVLTYNRTLEGYVRELARQQVPHKPELQLQICTFAKWAREFQDDPIILDENQISAIITPLLGGFPQDRDFLLSEVEYVLGRFRPENLESYVATRREGRGANPKFGPEWRRKLLDQVVYPYIKNKNERNVLDWNDIAVLATSASGVPWDVVVVDEAQDFSANQVRAVVAHLATSFSATFVIDTTQRIYPRFFTWKEAGVEPVRVKRLSKNYRNTKEIAAFAAPLVSGLPLEDDGSLPDFSSCTRGGPKPIVVSGFYNAQVDWVLNDLLGKCDLNSESVAFLKPRGGGYFSYLKGQLHARGISYVEITRNDVWPTGAENVALSTMHSAKGLEFDHVVMIGLSDGVTPHGEGDDDAQLGATRRLVAMGAGRARETVYVGYKPGEKATVIDYLQDGTYVPVSL